MLFINNIVKEASLPSHMLCKTDLTLVTTLCWQLESFSLWHCGSAVWGSPAQLPEYSVLSLDKKGVYVNSPFDKKNILKLSKEYFPIRDGHDTSYGLKLNITAECNRPNVWEYKHLCPVPMWVTYTTSGYITCSDKSVSSFSPFVLPFSWQTT